MWQLELLQLLFVGGSLTDKSITNPNDIDAVNLWLKYPLDGTINYYFFNWTNSGEFLEKGAKPNLEQVGPYQFSLKNERKNLMLNDNNTISFRPVRTWKYISGRLDDEITVLDPMLLTILQTSSQFMFILRVGLNSAIISRGATLPTNRSIRELLFDGYSDQLLTSLREIFFPNICFDKFGLFYEKNGTDTFSDLINIGAGSNTTFGKLYQINGNIAAQDLSLGDYFQAPLERTNVSVYLPDFCTSLVFKYSEEEMVNGILGFKYILNGNITLNDEEQYSKISDNGMLNIIDCAYGTPFFISQPYFDVNQQISGTHQNKSSGISALTIDPITGFTLKIDYKFQINLMLKKIPAIKLVEMINTTHYFPLMWYEYKAEISEDISTKIKDLISVNQKEV